MMKKYLSAFMFFTVFICGCRGETVLVSIDGTPAITEKDIPEYAFYMQQDSFFQFLDSVTDVRLILMSAEEENFEEKIVSDIEDLGRILIIDSLWNSIHDSLLESHETLAYKYWEGSQILLRTMLVRIPPGRLEDAEGITDSMRLFLGDSILLKEYVSSLSDRYNYGKLYFGPSGDLRDIFPYAVSFRLGDVLLSMSDLSVSDPIVTDTGIFILARLGISGTPYPGDYEGLKDLIITQESRRFFFEQTSQITDALRKKYGFSFNQEVFEIFASLPQFQRVLEEEPVVLPNIDEGVLSKWIAVAGKDTITVGNMIEKLKSGRILYPNLSDTSMLRLFLTRDIIPPHLLIQEAEKRGIVLQGILLERFEYLKDSLVLESYIVAHTGIEADSQEVYAYYLSNPKLFTIPERMELYIVGVSDSMFAEELLDSVARRVPFETLAERYSILPSAKNGGDLGYVSRGRYREKIESLIFSLEPNSCSEVFFLDGYWVVFKTGLHKTDSVLPFGDVFESCRMLCQTELRKQMMEMILINKRNQHVVEIDSAAVMNILMKKKEEL